MDAFLLLLDHCFALRNSDRPVVEAASFQYHHRVRISHTMYDVSKNWVGSQFQFPHGNRTVPDQIVTISCETGESCRDVMILSLRMKAGKMKKRSTVVKSNKAIVTCAHV